MIQNGFQLQKKFKGREAKQKGFLASQQYAIVSIVFSIVLKILGGGNV